MDEEEMMGLEYHHLIKPDEIMDQGNNRQQLLMEAYTSHHP